MTEDRRRSEDRGRSAEDRPQPTGHKEQGREARSSRQKGMREVEIEHRWRGVLLGGDATTEDYQQAYDELHREFLRQRGDESGSADGDIYGDVNPRSTTEDRVRGVILSALGPPFVPTAEGGRRRRVLEVGTGDGTTAYLLAREGHDVTSIDVSSVALARARERWGRDADDRSGRDDRGGRGDHIDRPGRLIYEFGDARALDYADGSFDAVISENVVEHLALADMDRHLEQVRRVLVPGGRYFLYTPSRLWSGRVSAGFHLHVYTLRELCDRLVEHGLRPAWLEPRLIRRMQRLRRSPAVVGISGLGLRAAWLYESLLDRLQVRTWPYAIKARIIPSVLVCAHREGER